MDYDFLFCLYWILWGYKKLFNPVHVWVKTRSYIYLSYLIVRSLKVSCYRGRAMRRHEGPVSITIPWIHRKSVFYQVPETQTEVWDRSLVTYHIKRHASRYVVFKENYLKCQHLSHSFVTTINVAWLRPTYLTTITNCNDHV